MIGPDDPRHGTRRGYGAGCRAGRCPKPRYRDCAAAAALDRYRRHAGELPPLVPVVGAARRLQALMAIGWSGAELSRRLGCKDRTHVPQILRERTWLEHATWVRIRDLYDQLSMTPGPSGRARGLAARRGFVPPLAWDDDTIDDPAAKPYRPSRAHAERHLVDPVVVDRALTGQRVRANPAERAEIIRRWTGAGRTLADLDRTQSWNVHRDLRSAAA